MESARSGEPGDTLRRAQEAAEAYRRGGVRRRRRSGRRRRSSNRGLQQRSHQIGSAISSATSRRRYWSGEGGQELTGKARRRETEVGRNWGSSALELCSDARKQPNASGGALNRGEANGASSGDRDSPEEAAGAGEDGGANLAGAGKRRSPARGVGRGNRGAHELRNDEAELMAVTDGRMRGPRRREAAVELSSGVGGSGVRRG